MGLSCSACGGTQSPVTPVDDDVSQTPVKDLEGQDPGSPPAQAPWQETTQLESLVQVVCGTTQVCVFNVPDADLPGLAGGVNYICGASFGIFIYMLQYYVMISLESHGSLFTDPRVFVADAASFDQSIEVHRQFANLTIEVRHPEESGYETFAMIFTAFMAVLVTTDVMQPVVIFLNVWSDVVQMGVEGWDSAMVIAPAAFFSGVVFLISWWVIFLFGKILAANEDVASIIGDALGLYVCCEIDNWVVQLINACALPMKTYWTHDEMLIKCSRKGWQAPLIAGAAFTFFTASGIGHWISNRE